MAKINIDIKNKDLPRIKAILEAQYSNTENPIDLSDNPKIIAAFEVHVRQTMKQMIQSFEYEKKRRESVSTVDDIDLT